MDIVVTRLKVVYVTLFNIVVVVNLSLVIRMSETELLVFTRGCVPGYYYYYFGNIRRSTYLQVVTKQHMHYDHHRRQFYLIRKNYKMFELYVLIR